MRTHPAPPAPPALSVPLVVALALAVATVAAGPALADIVVDPPPPAEPAPAADAADPANDRPLLTAAAADATPPIPCAPPDTVVAPATDDDSLSGKLRKALAAGDLAVALVLVLLGGLLTALSPCVYPLIPITLSILGARSASSHLKGFLLAGTYVGGMVILYTVLGVGFAAAGFLAGSALQSPIITIGVALLCAVMAASMFGAFEFALPSSLQTRLSQAGGAGFKGAFVMGLVAGVIAAPCTGPVLSFILTLIARDGDIAKGALLMFTYALGMGLPFLVLGTFSQAIARLPKSGRWMEVVKSIFGLLMLGAALYYLRIAFPSFAALAYPLAKFAWLGPLLLVLGGAVGALHLSFKMSGPSEKIRKAAGVALAGVGLVAFLAWANSGPAVTTGTAPQIAWTVVKGDEGAVEAFDEALALAKKSCKPVMVDFYADWCIACKELDHNTYTDDGVRREAQRYSAIKIDATEETKAMIALQKRFAVVGLPTIVFIDGRGNVLDSPLVTGFVDAPAYLGLMKRVR